MAYLESVIIRDTGGTEADVTAANALKVDGSAVTQPVSVTGGTVSAITDLQKDAFEQTVVSTRYNQVEINYCSDDPDVISSIVVTKTNGGDASNVNGQALFTSGANTNGAVTAVTKNVVKYRPHAETYVAFTAIWPSGGLLASVQRIGLFDANDGFYIGYDGVKFCVAVRSGGVDSLTLQGSWNVDELIGNPTSKYTRNGVPEAADFALDNLFRIRFGWLGAAPIQFEILSPDGEWVLFHIIRHPNTVPIPSIENPDLPITLEIIKTGAGATVLDMNTACWTAGTSSNFQKVTEAISDNTLATLNRSVITGVTTGGGGGYVNVKVNPSGALVTQPDNNYDEDTAHNSGDTGGFILAVRNDSNTAMTDTNGDYSPIAVNANGAVAINDGGNSITVDGTVGVSGTVTVSGTVAATQSGTWILGANSGVDIGDVTINNGAGASAVNIQDGGNSITIDGSVTVSSGNITAATDTSYAEDSAHTTGSKGTFILAVRNDSNTDFNATDGDYTPIAVTGAGAVKIHDGGNSITVDTVAVTRTPSIIRTSASGTISAGARSISVYNAGTAAGSILGVAGNILAGEAFDFSAGGQNDTLGSFAYDGTGTTLVITTIV